RSERIHNSTDHIDSFTTFNPLGEAVGFKDELRYYSVSNLDVMGRVVSSYEPFAWSVANGDQSTGSAYMPGTIRSYDAVGNVVAETDPAGRITTFVYDDLNRVTSVTNASGT